jgi:glycerol-3-phosphate acyltransferase PlsX
MRIAVDAMGGDHAPEVVIQGTAEALELYPYMDIVLVGHLEIIAPMLKKHGIVQHPRLRFVHAEQAVAMNESSTVAIRSKKNSSITVCADLVHRGEADAVVSAGHTGAAVAATNFKMKLLPGVDRAGIATIMPSTKGHFILIDAGANIDCKPIHLAQFAIMGEMFAKCSLNIDKPRVGLLSVGEEDVKGNDLTKETFKILSNMPINFIGNVEGKLLYEKVADVVVCDGFVGNLVIKSSESLAKALMTWLKQAFMKNPFRQAGAMLAKNAFKELKEICDYEEYGGAPLLGVNGICIIGHGSSSPKAVKNAIRVAGEFIKFRINDHITARIAECGITVNK